MATFEQPKTISDLLLTEVKPGWTKDKADFAAGAEYPLGTVLAKVSGKYQALNPAGEGDAKVAHAVAAEDVDALTAITKGTVIARGAAVESTALVWPAGATDAQKAAAIDELNARGIVVRAAL
ncbi:MAG: hypothetical protein H6R04_708 [Burkholderiaceae bacterium]|nr:hypothetical protein [Burkholderiaceae bacterium]